MCLSRLEPSRRQGCPLSRFCRDLIQNEIRGVLESFLVNIHERRGLIGFEDAIRRIAIQQAQAWFDGNEKRTALIEMLKRGGYSAESIEAEAFARARTSVEAAHRMIAEAQKRTMMFLEKIATDRKLKKMREAAATAALYKKLLPGSIGQ